MKKSVVSLGMIVLLMFSLGSACYGNDSRAYDIDAFQQRELQQECLSATIVAIKLEIHRHEGWIKFRKLQEDQKGLAQLEESLAALQADLEKYLAMDAKDYVVPEKNDVVASTGNKPGKDSVLYVARMSKNGPWYHLAGIVGDDYTGLQPNSEYHMNIYSIYPRSYWGMDSAYVYIGKMSEVGVEQPAQGKKIRGEVFMYKYGPLQELEKCKNYQLYLLKDINIGSKGKLVLDSQESSFDLTLSQKELEEYTYTEFVSPYGNKVIKFDEMGDNPIKVILESTMILKKPAIYLYPEEKLQITVTHNFKGKILNTYPAYNNNWTVIAQPNGNLLNVRDNRSYKYLFWDGAYSFSKEHYQFKSGFYVKNEDYVAFLQKKLAIIGLNENEINDFIVFWLPVMSKHGNSFVYFRINDNIDESSVLETMPVAETTIRVFMEFAGIEDLNNVSKLPEQNLPTFVRKGFTLVEWGGAEIGSSKFE